MSKGHLVDRIGRFAAALMAAGVVAAAPAAADVVRLKNGQSLEGDVIEEGGQVKIRSAGGTIGFPADIVLRIERGDSLERQAAKRLQAMAPNDVDGRVELALELKQAGASTLAQRILESVLDLDPDHPTARRALGYVRCGDEWATDEECHHLQGEALYQGRWVGSEERAALEALDHERRANELQRLRSELQLESARLQADRAAAAMSYGDYGYPYDPYYYGGAPYYPGFGFGGGGLTDGRFDRGHRPEHHGRVEGGSPGQAGRPGSAGGGRSEGGLHHRGGQPARPLVPTHSSNTLSSPR